MSKRQRERKPVNEIQKANKVAIIAKTDKQRDLLRALTQYEQVFATGPAGTGKTFIATSVACREFLYGRIKKIVITRPAVAACGEEYGFLPGSLHQKIAPWAAPVIEIIEEWLGKAQTAEALKGGWIEIAPFGFLRGRTFKDSFVIVDEAQNTTAEQMELLLTRMGEGSRLVVSGDLKQSDIKGSTGLGVALDKIERHNIPAGVVHFSRQDVVRSELCRMWVEAFAS